MTSDISSASSTSTPRYLTVLSSFQCPRRSWQTIVNQTFTDTKVLQYEWATALLHASIIFCLMAKRTYCAAVRTSALRIPADR